MPRPCLRPLSLYKSNGWTKLWSLLLGDDELIHLAADSGCQVLFFGVESVLEEQLQTMRKALKEIKHLESAFKKIKKMGIIMHASIVFGFDNDTKENLIKRLNS